MSPSDEEVERTIQATVRLYSEPADGGEGDALPLTLAELVKQARALLTRAREAEAERDAARAEIEDLKISVCAFAGPWAAQWARDRGLPQGHLHPVHYDILTRAGARMDDFTRAALAGKEQSDE